MEAADEARVRLLESFLPQRLRSWLAGLGGAPEEPAIFDFDGCALLTDVSGFTAFNERLATTGVLGAERVQEVLNLCFGRLTDLIETHGGEVIGFAGDATLAVWAETDGGPSACLRATRCAAAIRNAVDGLNAPGDFQLRLRSAVASGRLWAATVGGDEGRWQLLVGGEPLDGIGGVLALAGPGEVVVDEAVARAVPRRGTPLPGGCLRLAFPIPDFDSMPLPGRVALPLAPEAALRAFIPRTIQARIDAGQTEWLAEFRRVTVMFVGLGRIDREKQVAGNALHRATRAMQACIHGVGGSVTQMMIDDKGASLLAAWGIPLHAHEDDPARAVSAAKAIERNLAEHGIPISIGIATGRVWTGVRGNERRREFAMIGDVVNLAARLMQAGQRGVLCDARTRLDSARERAFEELEPLALKGKREPVAVFRPLDETGAAEPRALPPLIGRQAEQQMIFGALERLAARGESGLVVISGDPGLGKSHLVATFLERVRELSLPSEVAAGAIGSSGAYVAFREVFRRILGLDQLDGPEAERQRVLALLDGAPGPDTVRAPLLRGPLGIEWEENEITREMGPQARADATRELLVRLHRAAHAGRPSVLVLEDAQWLDSSTWSLAADLWDQRGALLLVVVARPFSDELPRDAVRLLGHADVQPLALAGLAADDIEALICQRLGVAAVPRSIVELIYDKSEGHPFFAEELAYALRDRGIIEIHAGECRLTAPIPEAELLPDRIEDVVTSRIDLLTPEQQLTLKVASVLGRDFELSVLADVHPLGTGAGELARQLAAMAALGLVLPGGAGTAANAFKHAITQQVTYELLPFSQRRRLHRSIAEWHERSGRDLAPLFAMLARHWRSAEDTGRALDYLEKAGDQAFADFANAEAVRFYGEALELAAGGAASGEQRVRQAAWRRRLGEAQSYLGESERSAATLETALAELGRPVPSSRLGWSIEIARQLERQLRRRSSRWLQPRVRPPDLRAQEQVRALTVLGAIYYVLDRPLPFIATLLSAANAAERAGPSQVLATAYADMGNVAGILPWHALARTYGRLALATADAVDEPVTTARVLARVGIYRGSVAHWQVDELERSMQIADRLGDAWQWEESAIVLSVHHYHRGEFERCEALGRGVCERARRSRSFLHLLWGLTTEAQSSLLLGRPERAAALCREAIAHLDADGAPDRDSAIKAHGLLVAASERLGDRDGAFASLAAVADLVKRYGRVGYQSFPGSSAMAEFYLARWEGGEALPGGVAAAEPARWACRYLTGYAKRFAPAAPRALLFQGRADWICGRRDSALAAWRRSLASAARLGQPFDEALAHAELAGRLGAGDERCEHASRATELFERLRTPAELARASSLLEREAASPRPTPS
jgi:class 3 adenylate cyclase